MLIRVKYPNGKFDMVKEFRLDYLIETQIIHSFERASGWVVLGVDPIRKLVRRSQHQAADRRTTPQFHQIHA
jgi:hypothetical protein